MPEAYEKLKPFHHGGTLNAFDLEGREPEDFTTDILRRILAAYVKHNSPTPTPELLRSQDRPADVRGSSARQVGKSTSQEAEVTTPTSARRSHKKRGGRR